jgi:hypothetical protein
LLLEVAVAISTAAAEVAALEVTELRLVLQVEEVAPNQFLVLPLLQITP